MKTKKEIKDKLIEMKKEITGLCQRCEHRCRFIETHGLWRPKYECGDFTMSKGSCYFYQPVKPVNLKVEKGDKRPIGIPMLGARLNPTDKQEEFRDTLDCVAVPTKKKGEFTMIYRQKEIKKPKGKKK
jgi:hypothetical protein